MRPFTVVELNKLAVAYCAGTGTAPSTLSRAIFSNSNDKVFLRLADGLGISALNAERASAWFVENWPGDVLWPKEVSGPTTQAAD